MEGDVSMAQRLSGSVALMYMTGYYDHHLKRVPKCPNERR